MRLRAHLAVLACVSLVSGCDGCGGRARPDAGASTASPAAPSGRLVVLGFDGVDPRWLERWEQEGKLPNLSKLMHAHGGRGYRRLQSTNPPQSPVAWTTFATGLPPEGHGIFDFLGRRFTPRAVVPSVATTSFEPQLSGPPVARNLRTGVPFWKTLADDGVRSVILNVPYSFPNDPMRDGRMLSGLGTPDLRGTNSTFTYAGTDITEVRPAGGGVFVPLALTDGVGRFELDGPAVPVEGSDGASSSRTLSLPVEVRPDGPGAMVVRVAGKEVRAELGVTSDFLELEFDPDGLQIHGIVQVVALEVQPRLRVFFTPISIDPRAQWTPVTYPQTFATQLVEDAHGLFKTVGWDHDTSGLNEEAIDDGVFLAQVDRLEQQRQQMLYARLAASDWELLVWVSTATDRVPHMFYRLIDPEHPRYDAALAAQYGDAIERQYVRMDQTIGEVVSRLGPDDTLLILSDHGFHNYRRGLHVNRWLADQGLLVLRPGVTEAREFLLDVDWSQTKAYALGTGQIYVNRRGAGFAGGIVNEGDVAAIVEQIRAGLLAIRDDERGGVQPVTHVYVGSEIYAGGARSDDAPDLQVAFAENYRTSWETILGGAPLGLFADNPRKWSGDHAASDVSETPGILVSNRPIAAESPAILDLAPTIVGHFGRPVPSAYTGHGVLAPR